MKYFPEAINRQYKELTDLLENNLKPLPGGKMNVTLRLILILKNYINHDKKKLLKAK